VAAEPFGKAIDANAIIQTILLHSTLLDAIAVSGSRLNAMQNSGINIPR
jgi:hypothetical protein